VSDSWSSDQGWGRGHGAFKYARLTSTPVDEAPWLVKSLSKCIHAGLEAPLMIGVQ